MKPSAKCKHCGDSVCPWTCEERKPGSKRTKCGCVATQCRECHNELSHGVIKNQNIHMCSSGYSPTDQDSNGCWSNVVRELDNFGD